MTAPHFFSKDKDKKKKDEVADDQDAQFNDFVKCYKAKVITVKIAITEKAACATVEGNIANQKELIIYCDAMASMLSQMIHTCAFVRVREVVDDRSTFSDSDENLR